MKHCEKEIAISSLKLAIELAGDGGSQPFTDKEYKLMYQLLDELSTNDEESTSTNNNAVVVVNEDDVDDFFADNYEDYKKIMGKCFINERLGIAVKILEVSDDFEPFEFIYERFDEWYNGWVPENYNWLQEQTKEKYEKLKLTPYANMNIAAEGMLHLGKNGRLYTNISGDDAYFEFIEITVDEFEKIRKEAIKN